MLRAIVSIVLFHIGNALVDASSVIDPEEELAPEDIPGWTASLSGDLSLPEEE